MAETLLMGLEGLSCDGSVGPVTPEGVRRTLAWASKHGFRLGSIGAANREAAAVPAGLG
jgi:predicted amino acid dehydrogenase